MHEDPAAIKDFYEGYHDRISDKRENSPYWLRRHTHRQIYNQFLPYVQRGQRVLDAGCGEGSLSCLLARNGVEVVAMDLSWPNLAVATRRAEELGLSSTFLQADAECLPFPDDTFDVVISSHVLEHLPSLQRGLAEVRRVTRSMALIAMPTCLNPACWALLGRDRYWKLGLLSPLAVQIGFAKTCAAAVTGKEGPEEGYGTNMQAPHRWRFPWFMRRQIESAGFQIERFEAGPLILPYLAQCLPALRKQQTALFKLRACPIFRNLGYGTLAVCRK